MVNQRLTKRVHNERPGYAEVQGLKIRNLSDGREVIWEPQARMIVAGPRALEALENLILKIDAPTKRDGAPSVKSSPEAAEARSVIAEMKGSK